jgi:hypothetical protein
MTQPKKSDVEFAGLRINDGLADSKIKSGATELTEHDLGQVSGGDLVITGVQGESNTYHRGE